jgi:hypothetical protein
MENTRYSGDREEKYIKQHRQQEPSFAQVDFDMR